MCGLVVSLRKGQHRIALWTKTCEESRVVPAGKKLKEALKVHTKKKKKSVQCCCWAFGFQ